MSDSNCFARVAALALLVASVAGCAATTRSTMLAPARPAIANPDAVRIYERPPRHYQEIALIEGKSEAELRGKAAAVGANGILPGGLVRKQGPLIGIGVGGASYSGGRHSAVGVGSSAAFDIPTGSMVMQGTAIYVP